MRRDRYATSLLLDAYNEAATKFEAILQAGSYDWGVKEFAATLLASLQIMVKIKSLIGRLCGWKRSSLSRLSVGKLQDRMFRQGGHLRFEL